MPRDLHPNQSALDLGNLPQQDPPPLPETAFRNPDPRHLFVKNETLEPHLKRIGQQWVFSLRNHLQQADFSPIIATYQGRGRRPYHPAVIMGLVLYGLIVGKSSLRDLERLAQCDAATWWVTGGSGAAASGAEVGQGEWRAGLRVRGFGAGLPRMRLA